MAKHPFFSVVIPAYNASKFLEKALDSVRTQTFDNYEIIVVNDGSTDNTLGILKAYFDRYPELNYKLIDQENKAIGGSRNSGIKEACGEFIAFLDADDIWYREKLKKVYIYLEQNPEADFVCHDEHLAENGKIIKRLAYGPYTSHKDLLFKRNCISTSATVVRRDKLLQAELFSEDMNFNGVEDYELWLRLSKICNMKYIHEVLGRYNVHAEGITNDIETHICNSINAVERHFKLWEPNSLYYRLLMNRRRADIYRAAAYAFLKNKDAKTSWRFVKKAIRYNPFSLKTWALAGLDKFKLR